MQKIKTLLVIVFTFICVTASAMTVCADEQDFSSERNRYATELNQYYTNLKDINKIDTDLITKMDKIYNSGMNYIKNASFSSTDEISQYISSVKNNLDMIMKRQPTSTKEFIVLSNVAQVTEAKYSQDTFVVLSLMNLGNVDVKNIMVTPKVSNDKKLWPFDITQAYDAQYIQGLLGSNSVEDAMTKRMDIGWNFRVRDDVLTGCYPLTFNVSYYMNGTLESKELVTYINILGKDPKKLLIKDEDALKSNPRIIVTGFTTSPEEIYAGSTFTISVQVKNTSSDTTVKNVLFDMEATVEGSTNEASYAAFLPTSGSSSVYTESIAPGATYDMSIEMEAKADLAQKPYVLTINMKYDTDESTDISNVCKVSVPIRQMAKLDISSIDMTSYAIQVGEETNVMFNIYNTGKTTLYNVKVTFEGESIDESGLTYLGNITPGQTGSVDAMITGVADDGGNSEVTIVISYEDETGKVTRVENPLRLSVTEAFIEENFDDMIPTDNTEEKQHKPIFIPILIGVVIIVGIVVLVIFLKKRKQRIMKQKDIDLLDDEL